MLPVSSVPEVLFGISFAFYSRGHLRDICAFE